MIVPQVYVLQRLIPLSVAVQVIRLETTPKPRHILIIQPAHLRPLMIKVVLVLQSNIVQTAVQLQETILRTVRAHRLQANIAP